MAFLTPELSNVNNGDYFEREENRRGGEARFGHRIVNGRVIVCLESDDRTHFIAYQNNLKPGWCGYWYPSV